MTNFRKLNKTTARLITSAGALALIGGAGIAMAPQAYAYDCLLDTNNDGNADSNVDTDAGADSAGSSTRLACGSNASAAGASTTALGGNSDAGANFAVAVGDSANASGSSTVAVGASAAAAGINSLAVGVLANTIADSGDYSIAVGAKSSARGVNAVAVGSAPSAGSLGADASGANSTAIGTVSVASGSDAIALGFEASTSGNNAIALGAQASATGNSSVAVGDNSSAGSGASVMGSFASSAGIESVAIGFAANLIGASGNDSTAVGNYASARGLGGIAIGADSADGNLIGANAQGDDSIVMGTDASDANFDRAIVLGKDALATEADQVILKSADTFTILGNGDVGIGTAAPLANLDINSGAADTTLLLNNSSAQWELKSKASTGRLNFKNLTLGGVPFKLGPNSVNGLLSVGTMADDLVEVRGELMVEGVVDVTGTLTTGGPTCGGGCDAVFGADYDLPSIEEHAAEMYANSYLPQVGPTVPHAPMNISETMGDMLNELEKAHIYIAQMNEQHKAEMALMKQQIALLMKP